VSMGDSSLPQRSYRHAPVPFRHPSGDHCTTLLLFLFVSAVFHRTRLRRQAFTSDWLRTLSSLPDCSLASPPESLRSALFGAGSMGTVLALFQMFPPFLTELHGVLVEERERSLHAASAVREQQRQRLLSASPNTPVATMSDVASSESTSGSVNMNGAVSSNAGLTNPAATTAITVLHLNISWPELIASSLEPFRDFFRTASSSNHGNAFII